MKTISMGKKAVNGFGWQMLERVLSSCIQFLLSIILARLVLPKEYGIISLISVFITISDLLVNAGFGTALIQKRNIDEKDVAAVFSFCICTSIVLWLFLFLGAPFIAKFYGEPLITPVLRVYGTVICPSAIMGLMRSLLIRQLEFKKVFFASVIPLIVSGIAGIIVAVIGGGVYSLVTQALVNAIGGVIFLELIVKWKPCVKFYKDRILKLWKYSWKLLIANLVDIGYKNLYTLCIPKYFGNAILGYYSYGRQIPNVVASTVNASIISAMFPVFSKSQDDINGLKCYLRKTIRISNLFIFPIMVGIAALADSIILLLLGAKWINAAWYLKFFCIAYSLQHVQNINFQAISAYGRSEVYLKYELIKKVIGIIALFFTLPMGMEYVMWGQVIMAVLFVTLNIYPNIKWLQYSFFEQICDIVPFVFITAVMYLGVKLCGQIIADQNFYLQLIVQVLTGVVIYGLTAYFCQVNEFKDILKLIKDKLKNQKEH